MDGTRAGSRLVALRQSLSKAVLPLRAVPAWRDLQPAEVLMLTATYGQGHIQAARALAEAMAVVRPGIRTASIDFFDLINPVFNAATRLAYIYSVRKAPVLWREFYERTARIDPDSFLQQRLYHLGESALRRTIEATQARVVVSTHPTPGGVVAELHRDGKLWPEPALTATVITDYVLHSQWVHPSTGLYLASCHDVADELMARGIPASRIEVTGIPIRSGFRRPVDREAARARWGLDAERPVVVMLIGAHGMMRGAVEACRRLARLPEPLQLVVVAGFDRHLQATLEAELAGSPHPVRVLGFVEEVPALMAASDVLVTKPGGLTVSEALAMGTCTVVYSPIPGQEEGNAAYLRRHDAAEVAASPAELAFVVEGLLQAPERRRQLAERARQLGRPDAATEAASLILGRGLP
ncbi:MGDG synthase family glycosyltransferase [Geochorda subterranea]|uniref:Glycosyltransferase n=1 Tax=Geochorda subterranea TaxID=3109564 RepID=A0ABZ1BRM8_9FIRM|nr:glycosyltransferase [Limnochorda sp. LNt]WRP15170.1 glycosyltransferase [Limnochorda sp. LNt]